MPAAARVGAPITHSNAFSGLLAGVVVGALVGAAVVATGGAAALVIAEVACLGGAAGGALGKAFGGMLTSPSGAIVAGSTNVRVNSKPATSWTRAAYTEIKDCTRPESGAVCRK